VVPNTGGGNMRRLEKCKEGQTKWGATLYFTVSSKPTEKADANLVIKKDSFMPIPTLGYMMW
jgi:hypothetical protein